MPEHLQFSDHLTAKEVHRPIAETHLGQAHIAGTGPRGVTCRECVFWHAWKYEREREEYVACDPGYFGKRHEKTPLELRKAKCNRPILNKANRLIPHHAKSCCLFEASERALPPKKLVAADA
ncbi:hypothetical protein LJR235_002910 [Pararhizobium sp. LjRoot235]|uniref:hypothetical protein n=1 Tax=Pararhizobium sp. LjRoot235 TaxID=3342291 RepID=UPI003ECED077